MQRAINLAATAGRAKEVPVGAVLVDSNNQLIATGENRKQRDQDPTAHAELLAIRAGCQRLGHWRLNEFTLYVTLEPCPMCTGAIIQARLGLLVYGTPDPKTGVIDSVFDLANSAASNHRLSRLGGICQARCQEQLQNWFSQHRQRKKKRRTQQEPNLEKCDLD